MIKNFTAYLPIALLLAPALLHTMAEEDPFQEANQLYNSSQYEQAKECYIKCGVYDSEDQNARVNFAETLWGLGEYEEGFKELDWRIGSAWRGQERPHLEKQWQGEDPHDKRILIRAEGGLGDTFFFQRYVALLKDLGAHTVVVAQGPLKEMLSSAEWCPYIDEVVTGKDIAGGHNPECYYESYMMSLPRYLCQRDGQTVLAPTTLDTVPNVGPAIEPALDYVAALRAKLLDEGKFSEDTYNIGICWHASKKPGAQTRMLDRDIPLQMFAGVSNIPGVRLYNLLSGFNTPVRESNAVEATDHADIISDDFPEIVDPGKLPFKLLAALMVCLDDVASVDTSIPNLAGTLHQKVSILLAKEADCRWGNDRSDSPWHPTAKLIRQEKQGDWRPVMLELEKDIREGAEAKAASQS